MTNSNSTLIYRGKRLSVEQALRQVSALLDKNEFIAAEPLAREIVKVEPKLDAALQMLGISLSEQADPHKLSEALQYCRAAVEINPSSPHLKNVLANALTRAGQFTEAEQIFAEALQLSPGLLDALYNQSKLYIAMKRYDEAEAGFQKALVSSPNNPSICHNLGICAYNKENYKQAILWFKLAIHLTEDAYRKGELCFHMGLCNEKTHVYDDAIYWFEKSLEFNPMSFQSLIHISYSLFYSNEFMRSEMYAEAYLEHCPPAEVDALNARMVLCSIYKATGNSLKAIQEYKKIVADFPDIAAAFSNMLLDMVYSEEVEQDELFMWCKKYASQYETPYIPYWPKHTNVADPERKLRIGYVSADFFNHSVSYFALPLITRHDKQRFEVITYAVRDLPGVVSDQYKKETRWTPLNRRTTEEFVQKIIDDKIDILIDLSGHTGGNQLEVFARKPAPIQATWLGYPFSTGLTSIDYRIVDAIVEPKGTTEHLNTERLVRIPGMFCAYRPSIAAPERLVNGDLDIRPTPAKKNGYITFGCCNNIAKVTDYTLRLWAKVLDNSPTAMLLIEVSDADSEFTRNRLTERFESNGVAMHRVILSNKAKNRQYSLYHDIDIVLDPFPCNGGTTTCDALFMSVPVVSLNGVRFMSRIGATALTNIGHPEWATESPDEYVRIATELASDIEALDHIRQTLRTEVENSPLMDEVGFTRKVERAYREMWRAWCATQHGETYTPDLDGGESATDGYVAPAAEPEVRSVQWRELDALCKEKNWLALLEKSQAMLADAPGSPELHYFNGIALLHTAQPEMAFEALAQAYQQQPEICEHATGLAMVLKQLGRDSDAEALLRKTCEQYPDALDAYCLLAEYLQAQGQRQSLASEDTSQKFNEAISLMQHVLEKEPKHQNAWIKLAQLQYYRNRPSEAEVAARRVLKLDPLNYDANIILAQLSMARFNFVHANEILSNLLETHPETNLNLAELTLAKLNILCGNISNAVRYDFIAVQKQPTSPEALSQLFCHLDYYQIESAQYKALQAQFSQATQSVDPEHVQHLNLPVPGRKLRIGFVSAFSHTTATAHMALPVFELINRGDFDILVYHNGDHYDQVAQHLHRVVGTENWRFTRGIDAEVMHALVIDDQIDILIDMDGHQKQNFLTAFARQAAPVQIKWLGNPGSTGLPNMNYIITDTVLSTESSDVSLYTEKPLFMQDQAFCVYRPFASNPEWHSMAIFAPQPAPAEEKGYFTFGAICDNIALTQESLRLWAKVLLAVPESKLLLTNQHVLEHVCQVLSEYGVEASRVITPGAAGSNSMLRLYQIVDIALDTLPCNQGLNSLDALWMGVPLVTLAGSKPAQRIGASILTQLKLDEWIASSEEEYVNKIIALVQQSADERHAQRKNLREMMRQSTLMNEVAYTKAFEAKLKEAWTTWCDSPQSAAAHSHMNEQNALQLCHTLMEQEAYVEAWEGYRAVLANWPNCMEALYGLGLNALLRDQPQLAEQLLTRALSAMMKNGHSLLANCLITLGQAYLSQGNSEQALACWQHAQTLQDSEQVRGWITELTGALH